MTAPLRRSGRLADTAIAVASPARIVKQKKNPTSTRLASRGGWTPKKKPAPARKAFQGHTSLQADKHKKTESTKYEVGTIPISLFNIHSMRKESLINARTDLDTATTMYEAQLSLFKLLTAKPNDMPWAEEMSKGYTYRDIKMQEASRNLNGQRQWAATSEWNEQLLRGECWAVTRTEYDDLRDESKCGCDKEQFYDGIYAWLATAPEAVTEYEMERGLEVLSNMYREGTKLGEPRLVFQINDDCQVDTDGGKLDLPFSHHLWTAKKIQEIKLQYCRRKQMVDKLTKEQGCKYTIAKLEAELKRIQENLQALKEHEVLTRNKCFLHGESEKDEWLDSVEKKEMAAKFRAWLDTKPKRLTPTERVVYSAFLKEQEAEKQAKKQFRETEDLNQDQLIHINRAFSILGIDAFDQTSGTLSNFRTSRSSKLANGGNLEAARDALVQASEEFTKAIEFRTESLCVREPPDIDPSWFILL